MAQIDARLADLDENKKDDKKRISALRKDHQALQTRVAKIDSLLGSIGGPLTDEQARTLILQKLYDLAADELRRYVDAEKRVLVKAVENKWDKYALSRRDIESHRHSALGVLDGFLKDLGYV
jgi:type I restriction enzyme M protein